MSKILYNINYLEEQDVNPDGSLKSHVTKGKPTLVMVQGNFCGYCTQAKPAFQKYANNNKGKVLCATIQGDGEIKGEKELGSRLQKIKYGFRGYPDYVKYKGGKKVPGEISGRTLEDLEKFGKI